MAKFRRIYGYGAFATASVIALLPTPLANGQSFLTNGLVAYYQFGGNANDASGHGFNGTLYGVTFAADRFGYLNQAASFAGNSTSYARINTNTLNLAPSFTVAAWAKFTAGTGTANPRILSTAGYEIGTTGTAGNRQAYFNNTTLSAGAPNVTSSTTIYAGAWAHVVGVCTASQLLLYVNGTLAGSTSTTQPPDYSRGFIPKIGGNSGSTSDAYGGLVDDLRIYNRALSATEVQQLFQYEGPCPEIGGVARALRIDCTNLVVGGFYQIQVSSDLTTWTNYGQPFMAGSVNSAAYVEVGWGNAFFRLQKP